MTTVRRKFLCKPCSNRVEAGSSGFRVAEPQMPTPCHNKVRLDFVFLVFLGLYLVVVSMISGTLIRSQVGNTVRL
jgi:hypothetical protein